VLTHAGLKPEDVQLVPVQSPDPLPALMSGEVDACISTEPLATLTVRNRPDLVLLGREMADMHLVVTRRLVTTRRETVVRLVAAEIRALVWMKSSGKNVHAASGWVRDTQRRYVRPDVLIDLFAYDRLATEYIGDLGSTVGVERQALNVEGNLKGQLEIARTAKLVPADTTWEKSRSLLDAWIAPEVLARPAEHRLRNADVASEPL
jgi:hypothetical protein